MAWRTTKALEAAARIRRGCGGPLIGRILWGTVALSFVVLVGCRKKEGAPSAEDVNARSLMATEGLAEEVRQQESMLIRGCDRLDREAPLTQICEARTELVIWHPASPDEISLIHEGKPLGMVPLDGGTQAKLKIGAGASVLERRRQNGGVIERVHVRPPSSVGSVLSAEDLQSDRIDDAISRNTEIFEGEDEDLAVFAAVNLLQLHLVKGQPQLARAVGLKALARFRDSMQHRAVGTIAAITAHVLLQSSSTSKQLESVLEALRSHGRFDASTLAQAYFNEGRVAVDNSNLRGAIAAFAAAGEVANRVAMADVTMAAGVEELYVTAMLGDFEGFSRRVDPVRSTLKGAGLSDCDYGRSLSNLAWSSMVVEETLDDPDFSKALEILEEARPLFEVGGRCEDKKSRIDAALNAAFAHLRRGELAEAAVSLDSFDGPKTALQEQWSQLVGGMLEAKKGNTSDALRTFVALVKRAGQESQFDLAWRAIIAAADAAYEHGEVEDSLAFHRAANRLLSDQLWSVSADDARELFVASRRGAAVRFVERLLAQGRLDEAWCEFRLSRTMALRTFMQTHAPGRSADGEGGPESDSDALEAWRSKRAGLEKSRTEDWGRSARGLERAKSLRERETVQLRAELDAVLEKIERSVTDAGLRAPPTCEALAPLAPGELWIGLLPGTKGEMVALFATDSGIKYKRFASSTPTLGQPSARVEESEELLAAIDVELERSDSVHILGHSTFVTLDVHAMRWRGQPLIYAKPVSYRLDLPRTGIVERTTPPLPRSAGLSNSDRSRVAFVVGDPGRNLAAAAKEATSVAASLTERGWTTTIAKGKEARAESILRGVDGVDWFHYAGHATQSTDGWGGELALGHGQRVTAADFYLLQAAPRVAVLAACEAGSVDGARVTGGLTLATSMLLRGSEFVIAPIAKVSDDVAAQFTAAFYGALARRQDVPDAFAVGVAEAGVGHDVSAWAPFRLWRP